jgi:hypothetical protein
LEKRIAEFTFKAHVAQKYEERNEVAEETEPPIILDEETEARVNAEVERIINSENQLAGPKAPP